VFLSPPEKVQRTDGSKVKIVIQGSWRAEMVELWKVCKRKEVRYIQAMEMGYVGLTLVDHFAAACFLGCVLQPIRRK
jgi:hypothetical protein